MSLLIETDSYDWLTKYSLGSQMADWLVLAGLSLFVLVLCAGIRVFWRPIHKPDTDEREKEYWHIHGGE